LVIFFFNIDYIYDLPLFEKFISDFILKRQNAILINQSELTLDKLLQYKSKLLSYSQILNQVRHFRCSIEFSWTDTITNKYFLSIDINFEYYCILYNLAIVCHLIGRYSQNTNDSDKLIEASKYFNQSAYLFNKLQKEYSKTFHADLNSNFLTYVM